MLNILYLYNSTQTYTSTVYEHIEALGKYSGHRSFFCHYDNSIEFNLNLNCFDAVAIHYTIRLPFDNISISTEKILAGYKGLKFLFIQDEYDHTCRTWEWIRRLGIQLVFTVVPEKAIQSVYPQHEFPATRFVSVLTGYVPERIPVYSGLPPSKRQLMVGYRGRPLPIRYGILCQEKIYIGKLVKQYCESNSIAHDIEWTEENRIYGNRWYEFILSCRAMLGTESGSNVFDWDGTLVNRIHAFTSNNPHASDDDVYHELIEGIEKNGLMNQISPRVFEAISLRTALVLFEGDYSGIIKAGVHYIPLKKDGANLEEVFRLLADDQYIDQMTDTAYQDIVASGRFSYNTFVNLITREIEHSLDALEQKESDAKRDSYGYGNVENPVPVTTSPYYLAPLKPPEVIGRRLKIKRLILKPCFYLWSALPENIRSIIRPLLKRLLSARNTSQ